MTYAKPSQEKNRNLFIARAIVVFLNLAISAGILFIAAGQLNWFASWFYLLSYLFFNLFSVYLAVFRRKEVSLPEKGATWDRLLQQVFRLTHPLTLILAGLEYRIFGFTSLPLALQITGFAFLFLSFGLILWAQVTNPYYNYQVPQQKEWKQKIISTGPYEFIRHPGNAGMLLLALARPVLLGSFYGLIPGILGSMIMLVQTFLEDRALCKCVAEYQDYMRKTKYRLLEYIW